MTRKNSIREEAYHFLKYSHTAVIATSFKNRPHAATVYFGIDENLNFYFVTKRNTSKYFQTCLNNNVAIVVGTGPKHIQVQAQGSGDLLLEDEREKAIKLVEFQVGKPLRDWPIQQMEIFRRRSAVAFKIIPSELTFMNLDDVMYPFSLGEYYHHIITTEVQKKHD